MNQADEKTAVGSTKQRIQNVISVKGGFYLKHEFAGETETSLQERSGRIEAIIRQYADMIYRIAYQNTGNHADAEDILQEVSVALVTKNAPLEDEAYLKRWLIRVTVNRCHDWYRHHKRMKTEPLEDHLDVPVEEKQEIYEELQQLSENYRNVLYLYYYENCSIPEIARILGKSVNTISSQLRRARHRLKLLLTEEGTDHA